MKSRTIFLIQLSLWLSCILTCGISTAQAAMAPNQEIQAVQSLEDTLFAIHYDQDSLNDRVSRLETTVFGQAQTGTSIEARITKLQGSLSPKALGPLSPIAKQANSQPTQTNTGNSQGNVPNNNAYQPKNNSTAVNSNTTPPQVASNSGTSPSNVNRSNRQSTIQPAYNGIKGANNPNSSVASSPEPGETDYPTVSQMESKLFGKTFPKEDITQRLTRLETQVFKMPQTGSLADRTDNLRMVVLGDVGQGQPVANSYQSAPGEPANSGYGYPQPPNYGGYNGMGNNPASGYGYGTNPYGNTVTYGAPANYAPNTVASAGSTMGGMNPMPGYSGTPVSNSYQPNGSTSAATSTDMMAAMNEVEKEVLGKTYPSEPVNTRLDRLETKVFKATSPDMNPQDRMQRVIAVASAGGSPMTGKAKAKSTFQVLLPIILTILPLVLL